MSTGRRLNLDFEATVAIGDIPVDVVAYYMTEDDNCPISFEDFPTPDKALYERYKPELAKMTFIELLERVQGVQYGSLETSGYAQLQKEYSRGYMTPEVYDHESAYSAIMNLHLEGVSVECVKAMDEHFAILEADRKRYGELNAKEDLTRAELKEMEEIDNNRTCENEPDIVGLCCRGVPVVEDDQQSELYTLAQSVLELPFAFCRVVSDTDKKIEFNTVTTSNYLDGLKIIYGLEKNFTYDITKFLSNLVNSYPEKPKLGNNHYDNAKRLMGVFSRDRRETIRIASFISGILYRNVSELRRKKYFVRLPKDYKEKGNMEPVLWDRSFKIPVLPNDAGDNLKRYTKYIMLLQELRGKGDKFSDKMYRLPVGDASTQVHVENAVYLQKTTKKRVVVVNNDYNTLIKIAWAIYLHKLPSIFVNMTAPTGKLSILESVCTTNFANSVRFVYKCSTITSPQQNKNMDDAMIYNGIYQLHFDCFNAMQVGYATVVKSFYFPPIAGIQYIQSSEPHNGSIIVYKTAELTREKPDYQAMWKIAKPELKRCLDFSLNKTMFTLCRERVFKNTDYRVAMRTEALPPSMLKLVDDQEREDEMIEVEDDYVYEEEGEEEEDEEEPPTQFQFEEKQTTTVNSNKVINTSTSTQSSTVVAPSSSTNSSSTSSKQKKVDDVPAYQDRSRRKKVYKPKNVGGKPTEEEKDEDDEALKPLDNE